MTDESIDHGLSLLREGKVGIREARRLLRSNRKQAERTARHALETLRSAMNWLEDTRHFERAHEALDRSGGFVRRTFGCSLHQKGTNYFQTCPVALAHNRVGMSPAMVVRQAECSICGGDPEVCPHIAGRSYDGERCHRVIKDAEITEVSLVTRPRQPDARITKTSIDIRDLERTLPAQWRPGMPVNCDLCLSPCDGVVERDLSAGH